MTRCNRALDEMEPNATRDDALRRLKTSWRDWPQGKLSDLEALGPAWELENIQNAYLVSDAQLSRYANALFKLAPIDLVALYLAFGHEAFLRGPTSLFGERWRDITMLEQYTLLNVANGDRSRMQEVAKSTIVNIPNDKKKSNEKLPDRTFETT